MEHGFFIAASYAFAGVVLLVLIVVSYMQWCAVRGDYKKLFGGGDA